MEQRKFIIYGLYSTDKPTECRYVGVTSRSINERFRLHKYCASHEEKRILPVHKWMYSKYSKGYDIKIKEIEQCDETNWEEREIYWISEYGPKYDLMNLSSGGKGVVMAGKRSEESIQKAVAAKRIPIVCLSLDGEFILLYESYQEAADSNGVVVTAIMNAIKSGGSSAGYLWVKKDEYNPNKEYHHTAYESLGIDIFMFSKQGKLLQKFNSYKDALEFLGVNSYSGLKTAIYETKLYHNYYFNVEDTIKIPDEKKSHKFFIYDISDKELKTPLYSFNKIKEMGEFFGIKYNSITQRFKNCGNPVEYKEYLLYRNDKEITNNKN